MPSLDYFIVAQIVTIDRVTNAVSAINVFEEVRTPDFPVLVPSVSALAVWRREEQDGNAEEFQCQLRVTSPGQEPAIVRSSFTLQQSRHRILQTVQFIPVTQVGEIIFELLLNDEVKASYRVPVTQDASIPAEQMVAIVPRAEANQEQGR